MRGLSSRRRSSLPRFSVLAGPIWLGDNSSVMKRCIERLYATSHLLNADGQYAYYGRVAGCLITGNEDGIKHCAMNVLYSLQHLGYTHPAPGRRRMDRRGRSWTVLPRSRFRRAGERLHQPQHDVHDLESHAPGKTLTRRRWHSCLRQRAHRLGRRSTVRLGEPGISPLTLPNMAMMRTRRAVHLWEWVAEGTGTGFVLFCTLTAIYWTERLGSPFTRGTQSTGLRLLVIGVCRRVECRRRRLLAPRPALGCPSEPSGDCGLLASAPRLPGRSRGICHGSGGGSHCGHRCCPSSLGPSGRGAGHPLGGGPAPIEDGARWRQGASRCWCRPCSSAP